MKTPTNELSLGIQTLEALDAPDRGDGKTVALVVFAILGVIVVLT